MRYNKYFRELYQDNIKKEINGIMTNNNNNNNYKNNNNNFTIEQTHNNMVINGNNIMKSFDSGNSVLNKNDKMFRNFSGILKNETTQNKNENENDINKGFDNYDNNNKVLTNSMSQNYFK